MDDGGHRDNRRQRMDLYKGGNSPWNMMPQYQIQEQIFMNTKISALLAERDAAIEERDRALSEKRAAIGDRDVAMHQRDTAVVDRDNALRERDNAIAALQFQESTMNAVLGCGSQRGTKRMNNHSNHHARNAQSTHNTREFHLIEALPITAFSSEDAKSHLLKRTKVKKGTSTNKPRKSPKKAKKVGEDLNRHMTTVGSKAEWDALDLSCINQINFDETMMPIPVCTCTGLARQCYKWGNGGWQSSCCTGSMSVYPLPQVPNKRHARMGGRKMSGSVFSRLLTRVAAAGHDLSLPLDLRNYWAKHGTNRYITIK